MSEFKNIMREYDRMCKGMSCCNCPIASANNGKYISCNDLMRKFPEEAERIIMQWAKEHPVMTNRKKFEEVFGFNVATMFEVNRGNVEWLDSEYKEGGNEKTN